MIDPCLPPAWKELSVDREFRGCRYHISFRNEFGSGKGVKRILADGTDIEGNVIPEAKA